MLSVYPEGVGGMFFERQAQRMEPMSWLPASTM